MTSREVLEKVAKSRCRPLKGSITTAWKSIVTSWKARLPWQRKMNGWNGKGRR
jgi:hypothetical protein